jgi:hypothetical protein
MTRRILWSLAAAILPLTALAAAPPLPRFAGEVWVIGESPFLQPVAAGQSVRVRFPVGELEIDSADVSEVRTELTTDCRELSEALCAKYRDRLRLEGEVIDGIVEVRLTGLPKRKLRKLGLEGRVTVPRWAPLAVQMGIGEVDIEAGEKGLAVAMGIGDLTIRAPARAVGTVRMATSIGDASLRGEHHVEGRRRRLLGATVDWKDGPGPVDIIAELRIGDATVVLE